MTRAVDIDLSGGSDNIFGGSGYIRRNGDSWLDSKRRSASYDRPWPIVYGSTTVDGIPLWVYDKNADGVEKLGNLAGGVEPVSIDPVLAAEVQMAFAFGPIIAIDGIIYEKRRYSVDALYGGVDTDWLVVHAPNGYVFAPEFYIGDGTTTAWAHYSAEASTSRIPWSHLAMFRARYLVIPNGDGFIPEFRGILRGKFATHANTRRNLVTSWTPQDAAPGDVIRDLLENSVYGLGLPAGTVVTGLGSNGLAASSYDRYCEQNNWWIALALDKSTKIADVINQILTATNSIGVWSEGKFKIIPLGDVDTGTYQAALTAVALTDDDFLFDGDADPITITRRAWSDTYNVVPVEYSADTKLRDFELITTENMDSANSSLFGVRRSDTISLPCIRSQGHATAISGILARQSCYNRSEYSFTVSPRHGALLEAGDLVALTHSLMGLTDRLARIETIDEDDENNYKITAREWITGSSVTIVTSPQTADGLQNNPMPGIDLYATVFSMASDGKITPAEKPAFYNAIVNIFHGCTAATTYGSGDWAIHGTTLTDEIAIFRSYLTTFLGFNFSWADIDYVWSVEADRETQRNLLAAWMTDPVPVTVDPEIYRRAFAVIERALANAAGTALTPAQLRTTLGPTGTPSVSTYLRGDGTWASVSAGGGGTVTGVTATAPVTSSGGTAPVIGIAVGTGAATVCAGNDSRLSDSRPASDVSAWAKAASKPSYTAAEVGAIATGGAAGSISGYGNPTTAATANTIAYRDASGWLFCVDLSTSSDARLKNEVKTIEGALDKVLAMRGVTFVRKGDTRKQMGVIAQEVEKIAPEVVFEDATGMKSVTYGNLVGLLIEAIKELSKKK